jgi:diadenosine tetraphosphate (Ap4A) HIT family hydrolase
MADLWMPRDKWLALVRGENCPLCREIAATETSDDYGYTITDLDFSRLRLVTNQYVPGYCILICQKHVREPYELSPQEYQRFFGDMMRAGRALEKVFKADKMNFQILGNAVPHLHCHIEPRYLDDAAPCRPIDPNAQKVILKQEQYLEKVEQIRRALATPASS